MAIARRGLLGLGFGMAGASLLGGPALAAELAKAPQRTLAFANLRTGETVKATYWEAGSGYVKDALAALNKALRDGRTGDVHPMDPRLLDLMTAVNARVGSGAPIEVICGYRSPQTNAMLAAKSGEVAKHSLHMDGKAVDIRVKGVELRHLQKAAAGLQQGGVGLYPVSNFVHVDVGPVRSWQGT